MSYSGFVSVTAVAAAMLTLAGAAQAQQQAWGVSDTPQTDNTGPYCALWYGRTRPMLQLQVRNDRRLLILAAPEFTEARGGDTATLRFPTGFEAGIPIVNADGEGIFIVRLSPASVDTLLENLSTLGVFRVTVSGHSVSYPVWQDLAGAIVHLRNCESQLPAS
ncbi:hypothetical protein AB2N04_14035 [Nitratireductor sp. GISD-1A_MAKvit]|uniref:hypothetical protein n=1 Tax=Nitratireductor sp. GISD-1A_MAKvit TaxID=3234198 RepID=UPI0034662BA9